MKRTAVLIISFLLAGAPALEGAAAPGDGAGSPEPAGGAASPGAPTSSTAGLARAFDWTVGTWRGFRQGGAGGEREPMTMIVEPILGGDGQIRRIEIAGEGGVYHGFAVQVPDETRGLWIRQYVNRGRGSFSSLEGKLDGEGSTWVSVTPGRNRESRVVSRRSADGVWKRTMSVSEDGGKGWRVLWADELRRTDPDGH